jgi:hypothetical protein
VTFTEAERTYLGAQSLGRIATATGSGEPDVAPVTFTLDGDDIVIGGMDITRTLKHRNVLRNPKRRSSWTTWPARRRGGRADSRSGARRASTTPARSP